jgi:hypothetical protein
MTLFVVAYDLRKSLSEGAEVKDSVVNSVA